MADSTGYDLVVIGGGPAGYVACIRAAQLGMGAALVDERPLPGGTCLNVGCIPTKALLESSRLFEEASRDLGEHGIKTGKVRLDLSAMMARKDQVVSSVTQGVEALLWKWKVARFRGRGKLAGPGKVEVRGEEGSLLLEAGKILLAPGSRPSPLPGVELDGKRIVTSTEALSFKKVPEHLVVIGAGAIGLELGSVWRRLGARVTVLEFLDRILPGMDGETAGKARTLLEKQGLAFHLGARVRSARREGPGCLVEVEGEEPLSCSHVLLAAGRRPATEDLGLEEAGVRLDGRGFIQVDRDFATTAPGVFAAGDAAGPPMLAHKASEEALACVEKMAAGWGRVNYEAIPSIVYTEPEVAGVGRTEEELQQEGIPYRKGVFPFLANGRARVMGRTEGFAKILARADTDRILGVHIVGPRAGDLVAEAALALEFGASAEDLARSCHAHPTLAETLKEAALAVDKRALHV